MIIKTTSELIQPPKSPHNENNDNDDDPFDDKARNGLLRLNTHIYVSARSSRPCGIVDVNSASFILQASQFNGIIYCFYRRSSRGSGQVKVKVSAGTIMLVERPSHLLMVDAAVPRLLALRASFGLRQRTTTMSAPLLNGSALLPILDLSRNFLKPLIVGAWVDA